MLAWYVAKGPELGTHAQQLNVALSFVVSCGVADQYRKRFAGIRVRDLDPGSRSRSRTVRGVSDLGNRKRIAGRALS